MNEAAQCSASSSQPKRKGICAGHLRRNPIGRVHCRTAHEQRRQRGRPNAGYARTELDAPFAVTTAPARTPLAVSLGGACDSEQEHRENVAERASRAASTLERWGVQA